MNRIADRLNIYHVVGIALLLRLCAVVFSQGYAMHDDHFVLEDGPWQWFLPDHGGWFNRAVPPGHSVVYPAILYSMLWVCNALSITDPQHQMFVIRLLHAVWSVLAIPFVWKIAEKYGGPRAGLLGGLLFAVFWPLPFMSVRCLIEMVSIPPLMAGWWFAIRNQKKSDLIVAGVAFALAFCFRYHTLIVPLTLVATIWYTTGTKRALLLLTSVGVFVFLTQGIADWIAWGYPFAGPYNYLFPSVDDTGSYPSGPFYKYIVLILGAFLFPASLIAIVLAFRISERSIFYNVYLPTLVFVVAHSIVQNKQERFILPIMGGLIVIGAIAFTRGLNPKPRWLSKKLLTATILWFSVINFPLSILFAFSYSKRSRVEAMSELRKLNGIQKVLVVCDPKVYIPTFYAGREISVTRIVDDSTLKDWNSVAKGKYQAVLFFGEEVRNKTAPWIEEKLNVKLANPMAIEPGMLDKVLHWLNPSGNRNETTYIYVDLPFN